MLPKFASHLFHHSQRVAATAQNYALRNVLGLQNQTATSSGSLVNWTSAGGGAGGAKYNAGSRFYTGYNGAGRAITQANTAGNENATTRTDDDDEHRFRRPVLVIKSRTRPRSSSLHLTGTGRQNRDETFGVLKTIQLGQVRASHVLSRAVAGETAEAASDVEDELPSNQPRVLVRRNSTAASNVSDPESIESLESIDSIEAPDVSPSSSSSTRASIASDDSLPTDPSVSQHGEPIVNKEANGKFREYFTRIEDALASGSFERVKDEVQRLRECQPLPDISLYNFALEALRRTRVPGEPITSIVEIYNELLTRQIMPNYRTYKQMLLTLCERDREVARFCEVLSWRQKRRIMAGLRGSPTFQYDALELDRLRNEDNFLSAFVIFEAAQSMFKSRGIMLNLGADIYSALLQSCSIHANPDAALRVWTVLEAIYPDAIPANCYANLLGTYSAAKEIESAHDVFLEFVRLAKEGVMIWPKLADDAESPKSEVSSRSEQALNVQMLMWVRMIEAYFRVQQPAKAIALLEEMMDSGAGENFAAGDIPPPCGAVYNAFITGFIKAGDIQSALSWFYRMVGQEQKPDSQFKPALRTPRPNQVSWNNMLEALLERKMVKEANELFKTSIHVARKDGVQIRAWDVSLLFQQNVNRLRENSEISNDELDNILKFLRQYPLKELYARQASLLPISTKQQLSNLGHLIAFLTQRGRAYDGLHLLEDFAQAISSAPYKKEDAGPELLEATLRELREFAINHGQVLLSSRPDGLIPPLPLLHRVWRLIVDMGAWPNLQIADELMCCYAVLRSGSELASIQSHQWRMFTEAAYTLVTSKARDPSDGYYQFGPEEFYSFVCDIENSGFQLPHILTVKPEEPFGLLMIRNLGRDKASSLFERLGPEYVEFGKEMLEKVGSKGIQLDKAHSRYVDEYFPTGKAVTPQIAWTRYEEGAARGIYPYPDTIGRLMATCGRLGEEEKIHHLYRDGQLVLANLEHDKEVQGASWYRLEDQMIIALAQAGQIDKAHVHRQRIIDHGGAPSADAYGALIQCVRETTDDSSNACALWQESQTRGVVPNLYLYNTVISKLSRARKVDYALDLFKQMKAGHVRPSSVTYGAVIAACCRVGDAQSAEVLFEEMVSQKNFRPRIPPYNTMIQFYALTARERERALEYFNKLLAAGIQPTGHTYKLLIDCYGTIEPVNVTAMDDVFAKLVNDPNVPVQGVHWASLINSWGCVQKDLEHSIAIFESIATHPSSEGSRMALPDALCYEALINVLVTLRRADLISPCLQRLSGSGVHMTAYIANLLIKGYASAGDLQRARDIFESLQDPPVGVAAPNNHVPHDPSARSQVPKNSPVYREPSTWEAMVRAELGNGHRDKALALLQRAQERQFPPAVYARISGIMLDDSVSPWASNVHGEWFS